MISAKKDLDNAYLDMRRLITSLVRSTTSQDIIVTNTILHGRQSKTFPERMKPPLSVSKKALPKNA